MPRHIDTSRGTYRTEHRHRPEAAFLVLAHDSQPEARRVVHRDSIALNLPYLSAAATAGHLVRLWHEAIGVAALSYQRHLDIFNASRLPRDLNQREGAVRDLGIYHTAVHRYLVGPYLL